MAKEKKIEVGVLGDSSSFRIVGAKQAKGAGYFQSHQEQAKPEKRIRPGYLISRMDHPVTLSYHGEALVLAPRARVVIADGAKLGGLAPGVVFVPDERLKN
jgi:hypothetical protein